MFSVVPPTASVVVVVVILPSSWSLALGLRRGPRPPPPARTPIPDRETCPRGATMSTTTARRRQSTHVGHRRRRIEDNPCRSLLPLAPCPPPPPRPIGIPTRGTPRPPRGANSALSLSRRALNPSRTLSCILAAPPVVVIIAVVLIVVVVNTTPASTLSLRVINPSRESLPPSS
jgi:hypothetical protein